MTLPVSGAISFNNINVELGVSGTTQASLGQSSYRTLAGVPSGAISMSNFYGKANQFAFTISSNQTNANLRTLAINAGWNQSSKVAATIGPGVYISSNSTGTPALTVNGSFPGGVELVNNGYIVGMGGNGGAGASRYGYGDGSAGASGGLALSVSVAITINNASGVIGGGGGGGGGGGWSSIYYGKNNARAASGSGGGGGRSSAAANSSGGAGGAPYPISGGMSDAGNAGGTGTVSAAGGGGSGAGSTDARGGVGGSGGGWGAAGSAGGSGTGLDRNGPGFSAGAGGGAVAGNASITWISTGTRYGGIS